MELSAGMWGLMPILVAIAAFVISHYVKRWRHQRILQRPFPDEWQRYLQTRLPVYERLSTTEQQRLHQTIHLFLAEKTFYGCAGLEMTDEMRVCIAAQACMLYLGRNAPLYPQLQSILVYPGAFRVSHEHQLDSGIVAEGEHELLGESWDTGRVILSWSDAVRGADDFDDGHNVVLHEFAHQLDSASGTTNGAPPLLRNSYQSWARIFSDNFDDLRGRVERGKPTVMDPYGATNEAEFFAVATETFFEKPRDLQQRRPELYEELQQYYQLDPLHWHQ